MGWSGEFEFGMDGRDDGDWNWNWNWNWGEFGRNGKREWVHEIKKFYKNVLEIFVVHFSVAVLSVFIRPVSCSLGICTSLLCFIFVLTLIN